MAYPSDPDKYSVDINLESNENSEGIEFLNIGALNNIPINSIRIIGVKSFYNVSNILHNHNEIVTINNMFIDYRSTQVNTQVDSIVQNYNIRNLTIQNSTGPYIVYEGSFNQNAIGRLTLGPGLTEIQSNAFDIYEPSFRNYSNLTDNQIRDMNVTIADQAQPYSIGIGAFYGRNISDIVLSKTLISIGNYAFNTSTKVILLSNIDHNLQQYIDLTVYENNRNLRNIDFSGHDLSGINLSGADLSGANLSNANLDNTDLTNIVYGGLIGPYTGTPIHNITYHNHDGENLSNT